MNIFIYTDRPTESFRGARLVSATWRRWLEVRAADRRIEDKTFTAIWPPDLRDFSVT